MGKINLQFKQNSLFTSIPNAFFDQYMPKANGEFLKVYLYLLRWCTQDDADISLENIADTLNMTERDIQRALRYWQNEGLLGLTYKDEDTLDSITLIDQVAATLVPTPKAVTTPSTNEVNPIAKPQYSMEQIEAFMRDKDGDSIIFLVQAYIGKPLNQTELNTITYLHEGLGFSADLIDHLVQYCVSNNHNSMRYIEQVAINWHKEGIDTVEKAKQHSKRYKSIYYSVLKAFGLNNRQPSQPEIDWIDKWHKTDCFSPTLIIEACHRTIEAIQQPKFSYANKILESWKKQNVVNLDDIKTLDEQHKNKIAAKQKTTPTKTTHNKFHNFDQRSYDYEDLELKLAKKLQA